MPDQTFSPPEPEMATPPRGPVAPGSGLPPHTAAGLACLGALPTAVIFYFVDRRDPFVRLYALQMMIWSGIGLMISKLFDLLIFMFHEIPIFGSLVAAAFSVLYSLFGTVWVCGWLAMSVLAFLGKPLRMPPAVGMIKRYLFPPR